MYKQVHAGSPLDTLWLCLQCLYMYNLDKDELICKSCPVYGTEPGELLWPSPSVHTHLGICLTGGRELMMYPSKEIQVLELL